MSLAAGLAAELAGCACAAAGAAAARLPAASMPCRNPRRSFVLEFILSSPWCTLMVSMIIVRSLAVLWFLALSCYGQGLEFIKSHYTKYEFQIPMRDGKRLFTSVYVPKDTSPKYPIMLSRTPYSV